MSRADIVAATAAFESIVVTTVAASDMIPISEDQPRVLRARGTSKGRSTSSPTSTAPAGKAVVKKPVRSSSRKSPATPKSLAMTARPGTGKITSTSRKVASTAKSAAGKSRLGTRHVANDTSAIKKAAPPRIVAPDSPTSTRATKASTDASAERVAVRSLVRVQAENEKLKKENLKLAGALATSKRENVITKQTSVEASYRVINASSDNRARLDQLSDDRKARDAARLVKATKAAADRVHELQKERADRAHQIQKEHVVRTADLAKVTATIASDVAKVERTRTLDALTVQQTATDNLERAKDAEATRVATLKNAAVHATTMANVHSAELVSQATFNSAANLTLMRDAHSTTEKRKSDAQNAHTVALMLTQEETAASRSWRLQELADARAKRVRIDNEREEAAAARHAHRMMQQEQLLNHPECAEGPRSGSLSP